MSSVRPSRSQSANIPIFGIVGGVGAGKSSIIRNIATLKLHVIDADQIGHQQIATASILKQIVTLFGNGILDSQGNISRPLLAAEAFGESPEQIIKRTQLNAIVHPAIRVEIQRQIQSVPEDVDAIILDAALLLEAGWDVECNAVIFVDTPLEQRQQRVARNRNWTIDEHDRREASQWSLDEKRSHSQFTVDNSGTVESASKQMESVLQEAIRQFKNSQSESSE